MGNIGGMVAIMGVCGIVLLIGAMGKKVEWLVNFILRAVIGTIGIYFLNYLFVKLYLMIENFIIKHKMEKTFHHNYYLQQIKYFVSIN